MDTLECGELRTNLAATTTAPFALGPSSKVRRRASSQLTIGSCFGWDDRYQLLQVIACGGTSVVHAVYDHALDRKLAGKFMVSEDDELDAAAARLEAWAIARLSHPNIVTVYDVGVCGKTPFLLMELLRGSTLADEIARRNLPPRRAIDIVLAVSLGLAHAHDRGVLHLDLKPGNVHLGDTGEVKILDFGVGSRHLTPANDEAPIVVGTPHYMAPEQWNLGVLDARTDVWALGILLYECLSGRLPCEGRHPGFALASGKGFWVPPLSAKLGLPSSLDSVIQRALATDPDRRIQTVQELATVLGLIQRVLLERDVQALSSSERRLASAAAVIESEFDAAQVQVLTGLSGSLLSQDLTQLVRRGALCARRGASGLRYRVHDRALSRACFQELQRPDRLELLDRAVQSYRV